MIETTNMQRIVKALRILFLGCRIEMKRKSLMILVKLCKTLSADAVIRKNNELSILGIQWMNLSESAELSRRVTPLPEYNK